MEEIKICQCEVQNLEKQMTIHLEYMDRMAEAEAKRINAIRAASQAVVLANQVLASADALRLLVSNTNNAVVQEFTQISTQLSNRIALLEKNQYENNGRSGISSPLLIMIAGIIGGVIVFIIEKLISL